LFPIPAGLRRLNPARRQQGQRLVKHLSRASGPKKSLDGAGHDACETGETTLHSKWSNLQKKQMRELLLAVDKDGAYSYIDSINLTVVVEL
jgi:hypothetical protein